MAAIYYILFTAQHTVLIQFVLYVYTGAKKASICALIGFILGRGGGHFPPFGTIGLSFDYQRHTGIDKYNKSIDNT